MENWYFINLLILRELIIRAAESTTIKQLSYTKDQLGIVLGSNKSNIFFLFNPGKIENVENIKDTY